MTHARDTFAADLNRSAFDLPGDCVLVAAAHDRRSEILRWAERAAEAPDYEKPILEANARRYSPLPSELFSDIFTALVDSCTDLAAFDAKPSRYCEEVGVTEPLEMRDVRRRLVSEQEAALTALVGER